MNKILIFLCIWLLSLSLLHSQEVNTEKSFISVNQSTLIGIGKSYLYDSYLSPLKYEGTAISLLHDRIRKSSLFENKLLIQNQYRLQTGITKNPTSSASEYWGNLFYNLNGFYPLLNYDFNRSNLRFYGGGGPELALGGIYNVRNSNNPGSLKTYANANIAALAIYNWRLFTFRWQFSTPFAGMFFSPEYGHSYYEIFTLGNNKGTVHFGSFHNQLAMRNYFSIDFPIQNITIRTGYLWDYYNSDVNELTTKISAHQFMIGLVFETLDFGGNKARNNSMFKSAYY